MKITSYVKILTEGRVHFENLLKNLFARIVSYLD